MECDEGSPSLYPQCPAGSALGRRNVVVKSEEFSNDRVELTVGVKTSKSNISIKLSSCFCEDSEACVAHHHSDDEHEDDSDNNYGPSTVYAKVEASQKDIQHGKDKETAAAQTQMPSTKPKARTLVASRQLIDATKVASLRDQSPLPLITLKGAVSLASTDPKRTSSVHASITGEASVSAAQRDEAPRLNRKPYNITRKENKSQYYRDLCLQVEERKQQIERERNRNTVDEQKHNETMQHSIWGMPGSGAPNSHLGTAKRTNSLYTAGILPQEQIRDKGFSGTPFHHL
ncbi:uncharacterized protein LOC122866558 [Siniperca chuatsi]|uniref:uncharacterized protein LOC122866558 n=1 Tax=Siniperca chuatsi TaxID=119488 RepID=UPI001CE0B710|nr:uncharacterized protein LOC122866558 [Siniperca chuatsi]